MRRKQSPSYDPASTEVGLAEPEWGIGVRSLTEVEEDPFASGEMEDPFALEYSPAATSSPQAAFSSLFLPPPHSPSFDFGPTSPTLKTSQINQYATHNGYPDDVPFVLSADLGATLEFEGLSERDSPEYPEDDFESDDGRSQYVVMEDQLEDDDDEALSTSPLPTSSPAPVLFSFPTSSKSDDLAAGVAQFCIEAQNQSIQRRGRFCVALSGGSMPKILAEGLIDDDRVIWDKWEVFFCDERLVPLDHPDSTFAAYEAALFAKVPIPAWQIHSIMSLPDLATEPVPAAAAEEIAADYETQFLASFPDVNGPSKLGLVPSQPRFDLVLLEMGPDGHCANLFPHHPLLSTPDLWIAHLSEPTPPSSRLTFTLPLLSASRRLAFICTSASSALANVLDQEKDDSEKVPAGRVRLGGHPVVWSLSPDHTDPTVTDPDSLISTVPGANEDGTITTSAHRTYSFAAATWLSLLATPLLFFPRILSLIFGSLLTVSGDPDGEGKAEVIRQLNVLERSLAGLTGLACLSLAMILIVQSGVLPLTSSFASPTGSSPTALLADAPYRTPTVLVATFFFFSLAWYSYDLGMWVVTGVSGGMVIWGAWAILFASETRVNKAGKKAMDGAMSSFPFKNAHAEEAKKML